MKKKKKEKETQNVDSWEKKLFFTPIPSIPFSRIPLLISFQFSPFSKY